MMGFGESYFLAFALELGASHFQVGLLATVPLLVGSVWQLGAPALAARLGAKQWVVGNAVVQATLLASLVAVPWLSAVPFEWFFGLVCVYWASGLGINPVWNAWMGQVVPPVVRQRFFGRRNAVIQLALLSSVLAGGFLVDAADRWLGKAGTGFSAAFALAALCRLASAYYLGRQRRPPATELRPVLGSEVLRRAREEPYGQLVALVAALYAAVHLAAPYFTPYMLEELELSYARFTILNATILAARALFSPYWGEVAANFGNRRALQVASLLLVPLSALWAISEDFGYLLGLQVLAGFGWSGFELASLLNFFDCTNERNRPRVLSLYNLATGVAVVAGSVAGGWLLGRTNYEVLFVTSSALRLLCVSFLLRGVGIRRSGEHRLSAVFARVVTFRPGQGPLLRPVVFEGSGKAEP
ncbi:MAG: MFS transporter [Candidatus Binatia bacterium]|nr:MAG: MFS transporter [Candidatus Binatia bacterium]